MRAVLLHRSVASGWAWLQKIGHGFLVSALVALAAAYVSSHFGGPQLLYALLMGLSLHFLASDPRIRPGVDFCTRTVLRLGVALLGARITVTQVAEVGWRTALVVVVAVASTVALGWWLARLKRRPAEEGLISGGSVGICGASAALAISSVLPATKENERFTLLVIVGVTLLSTVAMVTYPVVTGLLGWSNLSAGIFLGATIHDVAQVVASATLLAQGGDTRVVDAATVVKLFRVMLLMPVVLVISMLYRRAQTQASGKPVPMLPGFLVAFIALVLLGSQGFIPAEASRLAGDVSRLCLLLAIASAGIKTDFADLLKLGWVPLVMLLSETAWIAAWVGITHAFWS